MHCLYARQSTCGSVCSSSILQQMGMSAATAAVRLQSVDLLLSSTFLAGSFETEGGEEADAVGVAGFDVVGCDVVAFASAFFSSFLAPLAAVAVFFFLIPRMELLSRLRLAAGAVVIAVVPATGVLAGIVGDAAAGGDPDPAPATSAASLSLSSAAFLNSSSSLRSSSRLRRSSSLRSAATCARKSLSPSSMPRNWLLSFHVSSNFSCFAFLWACRRCVGREGGRTSQLGGGGMDSHDTAMH